MVDVHNQKSFSAGEWSPNLYARVDMAKYHSAAALLRNFYVDYRGGASNRPGTKYILQCYTSSKDVRLIPFQASFTVSYVLELGDYYMRFYSNGAAVTEIARAITNITQANPAVVTSVGHGYSIGDVILLRNVGGMTQVNSRYFYISAVTANTYTLADLNQVAINSIGYSAYTTGGSGARVYKIVTPWAAGDLDTIKFVQNVNTMVFCHPSYVPYILTLTSAASWSLAAINFGVTIGTPAGLTFATTFAVAAPNERWNYVVTAVSYAGEESLPSTELPSTSSYNAWLNGTVGSNTITWTAVSGAASYNVYRTNTRCSAGSAIPTGTALGYIGNTNTTIFIDTNNQPDFDFQPQIAQSPFSGAAVTSATVTTAGAYTTVPGITFAAPSSGTTATGIASLGVLSATVAAGGAGYTGSPNDILSVAGTGGATFIVLTVGGGGAALTVAVNSPGSFSAGTVPANPVATTSSGSGSGCTLNLTWGVKAITIIYGGNGYTSAPAITFSAGAATATATITNSLGLNPSVPAFFQQRFVLAGQSAYPQTFYMSQTGQYFNFNVSNPIQDSDAITGTIVSSKLNEIKHMIPMQSGLITLTSQQAWQVSGGGPATAITPIDANAQAQAFNGCSDVVPIVTNYDIIFVQSKGSIVRDLAYDFYKNIWTGTDISIQSSHLFFGFTVNAMAFAEEPFKVIWAVRSDGELLSCTFMKEQELIGWAHHDTLGTFTSVATVTEAVTSGAVDAIYVVVQRTVNGNTVKYIERMAERFLQDTSAPGAECWFVDAGLQYSGSPTSSFTGAEHLAGLTVTGLADGAVITPFTMPLNGFFTLPAPASVVTLGLAYTVQLQTLILDLGEPSVTGKLKKIPAVTVRAADTLGIRFGRTLDTMVPIKDFSGTSSAQGVTLTNVLVTEDARQTIDPKWDQNGQFYIDQPYPLPVTILGVVPEVRVEDRK